MEDGFQSIPVLKLVRTLLFLSNTGIFILLLLLLTDNTTDDWITTLDTTMESQNHGIEDQNHSTWLNMLIAVIVPTGIALIAISSVIVATLLWSISMFIPISL